MIILDEHLSTAAEFAPRKSLAHFFFSFGWKNVPLNRCSDMTI